MRDTPQSNRHRRLVVAAAGLVVILGGLLAVRLAAREGGSPPDVAVPPWLAVLDPAPVAPPATVPAPRELPWQKLEVPCWSCHDAIDHWPIAFRTDLDLLAPLGDGSANAAEYFALFCRRIGPRAADGEAFVARTVPAEDFSFLRQAAPPDDPLLLESEPWVDQARMSFYPRPMPFEGWSTAYPNLLMALNMARSWTARGLRADDPAVGLDDCRRAIRLGRLLRQDDVVIITDLVGLECIHVGARGISEIARRAGDQQLAMIAATVLGEVAPQRFLTQQRVTALELRPFVQRGRFGRLSADIPAASVERLIEVMRAPERRFRGEAILSSQIVVELGGRATATRLRSALEEVADNGDEWTAMMARYALSHPVDDATVAEVLGIGSDS